MHRSRLTIGHMALVISDLTVRDIRFPTAAAKDGSDALNTGDYSATYVTLQTDQGLCGNGITFTNGRGNEICCSAVHALKHHVIGRTFESITRNMRGLYEALTLDNQLRWLGPEKGVVHLATAALVNAQWDLLARRADQPLWKYLVDLSPEQIVSAVDFRHVTDALVHGGARSSEGEGHDQAGT